MRSLGRTSDLLSLCLGCCSFFSAPAPVYYKHAQIAAATGSSLSHCACARPVLGERVLGLVPHLKVPLLFHARPTPFSLLFLLLSIFPSPGY